LGRGLAGIVAGLVTWFVIATILNIALRLTWPAYATAEAPMQFDLAMMIARLMLGAVSSFGAGGVAAWIARGNAMAPMIVGLISIALFVPVHYGLWDKFPVWYHITFLVSLLPFTMLGAIFARRTTSIN
jgi:hypothetical protein